MTQQFQISVYHFVVKIIFVSFGTKQQIVLQADGYFVGNFFGKKDSWITVKEKMIFLEKKDVLKLFEQFDIIKFEEVERDGKTGLGKMKHWHTFEIIAKKK